MNKAVKDFLLFAFMGLLFGAMVGYLFACGYMAYRYGIPTDQLGLTDGLRAAPWNKGNPIWWQHVLYLVGGGALVGMIGLAALSVNRKSTAHGSATWATAQELNAGGFLANVKDLTGPIYAKMSGPRRGGKFITSRGIPHSFVAAPTGSGKGVGVVIPTLLTYPGSVICLDVKGENFEKTARRRKVMGDKVFKFAPFDEQEKTHRFNPLEHLKDLSNDRRFTEAERIANALLVAEGKGAEGFIKSSKDIFTATTLLASEQGVPTLSKVYDILTNGTVDGSPSTSDEMDGYGAMFKSFGDAAKSQDVKKIFYRLAPIDQKTLSAYMSVLSDAGLNQWANPYVRRATDVSDFSISDLRSNPASIFLVVGPNDIKVLAPLIRLMFQQTVAILQRAEPTKDEPYTVLLLMDEFPALGKMDSLSQAITTLRSYGGRMMIVAQSISNLKATYGPDGAQNFLANCRIQLFMAPADAETPEYVSKAIGDFTRKSRSKSWQTNSFSGSNIQERDEGARLLRPEDMRRLPDDELILLIQGENAVKAKKVFYYKDKSLKPLYKGQTGDLPEPPTMKVSELCSLKKSMVEQSGSSASTLSKAEQDVMEIQGSVLSKIEKVRQINRSQAVEVVFQR